MRILLTLIICISILGNAFGNGLTVASGPLVIAKIPSSQSEDLLVCYDQSSGQLGRCPTTIQGEPGPAGPAGPTGATGTNGSIGPIGPKGDQGIPGLDGSIEINSDNYLTIDYVSDSDYVRITGIIDLQQDYLKFKYASNVHVNGGTFRGTGTEQLDIVFDSVFNNVVFDGVLLDSQATFINCTFRSGSYPPLGSTMIGGSLNGVQSTARIDVVHGADITNSTVPVSRLTSSSIKSSEVTGLQQVSGNRFNEAIIVPTGESTITGNDFDDSTIYMDEVDSTVNITGNVFFSVHPDKNEAIFVKSNTNISKIYNISDNTFYMQSTDTRSMMITGTPTANYFLLNINGNIFLRGTYAIGYLGNIQTVVRDNVTRFNTLGVSNNGTYLYVGNNLEMN